MGLFFFELGGKKKKKIEVEQTHRNRKGDARQAGDASRRSHAACARSAASCSGGTGRGVRLALTEGTAGGQLPGPGAHTSVRVWRRASGHAGDPGSPRSQAPHTRRQGPPLRQPWAHSPWHGGPRRVSSEPRRGCLRKNCPLFLLHKAS